MKLKICVGLGILLLLLAACGSSGLDIPLNSWTMISRDELGARRFSSFRYVDSGGYFLQWGFIGHVTEFYGGPDSPPEETPEYDLVYFDPVVGRWQNHLPFEKEEEWRQQLPPLHMVSSYQGIATGSRRPQLKLREGVLRPDLNLVFDQVAYDQKRDRMVFFTGGRTFGYDVSKRSWSSIGEGASPPPVIAGSLAYDPENDEMVLVGGGHVAETGPDGKVIGYTGTWLYDCATGAWRKLESGNEPPPRMVSRLVYDSKNKVMVLFGGDAQSHYRADTWIYDTRSRVWQRSSAAAGPPARAGHFTVYDPDSGWVMIGGGYNREELADMWAYDASQDAWLRLKGKVPAGWYVTADMDPDAGLIVLATANKPEGDTMTCNEIYSVRTTYAFRVDQGDLVDEDYQSGPQQEIAKRSKEEATTGTQPDPVRKERQLKRLQGMPDNEWVLLDNPGRNAPLRSWGSCSFDTKRGWIIYWGGGHCGYGGNDYDFYDVEQNTWVSLPVFPEYPERAWDKGVNPAGVTFQGAPWIRHGRKVYAYDPVSDKVVNTKTIPLTAGYDPLLLRDWESRHIDFGEGENYTRSGYTKWVTWVFDPETSEWQLLCSGLPGLDLTVTTPRGVMAVDHDWGGLDTGNSLKGIPFEDLPQKENAVYLLNVAGKKWEKLSKGAPWPQNLYEMTALVYDSRRKQLLLHGGGEKRTELWAFSLDRGLWRKLDADTSRLPENAPPVCRREAAYIPSQDLFFTCAYPPGSHEEAGVYVYRVGQNRWFRVDIPLPEGVSQSTIAGQNRAFTYDPKNNLVLMVLGRRSGSDIGSVAVYALRYNHGKAKFLGASG